MQSVGLEKLHVAGGPSREDVPVGALYAVPDGLHEMDVPSPSRSSIVRRHPLILLCPL